jgi:hypothetical protein
LIVHRFYCIQDIQITPLVSSNSSYRTLGVNNTDDIVHELNMHYMHVFIPNIIWNIARFLLGVVGNSLVLYVYKFKAKHQTKKRYFIPFFYRILI